MQFGPSGDDAFEMATMATHLVNTRDGAIGEELLPTPAALRVFLSAHDISGVGRVTDEDLKAVRRVRERLRGVFTTTDLDEAVATVNALVTDAGALPQLTDHDGEAYHLHFSRPDASLVHRLAAEAAMGLAVVLRDEGVERLQVCDAPDCEAVYLDASRNRSRRYCDDRTCGNRQHAAAYRARRRAT